MGVVSLLASVQLIFQGPLVNTHLQRKVFGLTTVPSPFIAVFTFLLLPFLLLLLLFFWTYTYHPVLRISAFYLLSVLSPISKRFLSAGLAVVTNLYSGVLILTQFTSLCCLPTSVRI